MKCIFCKKMGAAILLLMLVLLVSCGREPAINGEDYYGVWEYAHVNEWVVIGGDGSLYLHQENGDVLGPYQYEVKDDSLVVAELNKRFTLTAPGCLEEDDGTVLFLSELPEASGSAYFERNGISSNYSVDQGLMTVDNAGANYDGDAIDHYQRGPIEAEITLVEEEITNGSRYLKLVAIANFPYSHFSSPYPRTVFSSGWELYDYYSGYRLPVNENFFNHHGYAEHTLELDGEQVTVEIKVDNEWVFDSAEYAATQSLSLEIVMPQEYDGLVIALFPRAETVEEDILLRSMDKKANDYVTLLDQELLVRANGLVCRVER